MGENGGQGNKKNSTDSSSQLDLKEGFSPIMTGTASLADTVSMVENERKLDAFHNSDSTFNVQQEPPDSGRDSKEKDLEKTQEIPLKPDFEDGDPRNPINWSKKYKWTIVILVSAMTTFDAFSTLIIVPSVPQILHDFNSHNQQYSTLLVSIWELGEGLGPFLVAPLSEIYGRLPIYHIGNFLFILCSVGCALSTNIHMLVAFRFLSGFVITSLTLGPSIIGDIFVQEERGLAMSISLLSSVLAPVFAPIVGSFASNALGWRWPIWLMVIPVGALQIPTLLLLRETYKPKILQSEKAQDYGHNKSPLRSIFQQTAKPTRAMIMKSMTQSLRIMFMSPLVLVISVFVGLVYGLTYLITTTLTEIMESKYGFPHNTVGLTFLAQAIGMILAIFIYGSTSDRYLKWQRTRSGSDTLKSEHRLLFLVIGAVVCPVGFFLYGWTIHYNIQWVVPLVGTGFIGFSCFLAVLSIENYLVDTYGRLAASAVASGVIMRAIFGAIFPLVAHPLYDDLGQGWGNSVLGFIALAFLPVVLIMVKYGENIRKRDPVLRSMRQEDEANAEQ